MRWSEKDSGFVRKWYGRKHTKELADSLGRTVSAVYQHANSLGITDPRDESKIAKRDATIKEKHELGWNASEISGVVKLNPRTIRERLRKMGLKPHGRGERYRKRVAETTRKQCDKAGVKNLAELRSKEMKRIANRLGWPEHLSLRSVQILEILYQKGPMTRRQIADAIGMEWRGSRKTFKTKHVPGQSYLAELQRAGLVIRLEKAVSGKGRGRSQDLYMIRLEVEPCQKTRKV